MTRLSIRPRVLDIHKRIAVVKSLKEFEDDERPTTASTRNLQLIRLMAENGIEVHQAPAKKSLREIPIPQYSFVDTYERDYSRTFAQSTSYIRRRGDRAEIGEYNGYDMDNEDEDWFEEFSNDELTAEKFEILLFKLEVMDHKARERAGLITATFGLPVPVILQLDAAVEPLQFQPVQFAVLQSVYNYWKAKRERWQKPILRWLQPPPPVNDTNPYNVFRPREKAHRLHTRKMQRKENNVQSFEKLRQVRHSLDQAKNVLEALIKREEKKKEIIECEVNIQRLQMKYKDEAHLVEDGMSFPEFQQVSSKLDTTDDDYMDSDDTVSGYELVACANVCLKYAESKLVTVPMIRIKRDLKRSASNGWIQKKEPDEPVLLFTKLLDSDKLAAAGILQPSDPSTENGSTTPPYGPYHIHGRIGRGGRIIFDRWNLLW